MKPEEVYLYIQNKSKYKTIEILSNFYYIGYWEGYRQSLQKENSHILNNSNINNLFYVGLFLTIINVIVWIAKCLF